MILHPCKLSGEILVPPSKSDAQRAVLAAGLSKGTSKVYHVGPSDDEQQMVKNIIALGATVKQCGEYLEITGLESFPKGGQLNLGESGLGFRLVAGLCAVMGGDWELLGEGTLPTRPMNFFQEQFDGTGLQVHGTKTPIKFSGTSNKREFFIDGSQGSQFLSGLLMALPLLDEKSTLHVSNLKSRPYIDMTLGVLRAFGIQILHFDYKEFVIEGGQTYVSCDYRVESDWSSASCWLAASACGHPIKLSGLSMTSDQADRAMLEALRLANCEVSVQRGVVSVNGQNRKAFNFDANDCPDLFPALAVLASQCIGKTKIKGLNRLAIKESDRGIAIQKEWAKMGVNVVLDAAQDEMIIEGKMNLNGAEVDAHHDHRMAMSLAIMSTFCEHSSSLEGASSVAKSYPEFWNHFDQLKG